MIYDLPFDSRQVGSLSLPNRRVGAAETGASIIEAGADPWSDRPRGNCVALAAQRHVELPVTVAGWPSGTLAVLVRRPDGFVDTRPMNILSQEDGGLGKWVCKCWVNGNGRIYFMLYVSGPPPFDVKRTVYSDNGVMPEGSWRLIGCSWGPQGLELWVDGLLAATEADTDAMYATSGATLRLNHTVYTGGDDRGLFVAWVGVWQGVYLRAPDYKRLMTGWRRP